MIAPEVGRTGGDTTPAQHGAGHNTVISVLDLAGAERLQIDTNAGAKQARVFNLIIEGINLRTTEAEEVGAMLDRNRGDLDAMIADLRNAS